RSIATLTSLALLSCTPTATDRRKPPAATLPSSAASSPQTVTQKTTLSGRVNSPSDAQSSRVQDFLARQELGQTILTLKLAKPIEQFRHFPLAQPTRILLDIFTDAKQSTDSETFRLSTILVNEARITSGEGYIRLSLDITAGNVPPYTVTPDDGGVKIV